MPDPAQVSFKCQFASLGPPRPEFSQLAVKFYTIGRVFQSRLPTLVSFLPSPFVLSLSKGAWERDQISK